MLSISQAVERLPDWWERVDEDPKWQVCLALVLWRSTRQGVHLGVTLQEYSFVALSVGYGIIAAVALVQLARIQRRVPEFGWTTQKVFHLLNAFVCILRCVVFALRDKVRRLV